MNNVIFLRQTLDFNKNESEMENTDKKDLK